LPEDLKQWLRASLEHLVLLDSVAGTAAHCDNGVIEIDNSAAERALHGIAIGRRNYRLLAPTAAANVRPAAVTRRLRVR
jgi:transposase